MLGAFVLCSILLSLVYAYFYASRKRLYDLAALIPGPSELPLIGSAFEFYGSLLDIDKSIKKLVCIASDAGGVLKVWFGPLLYIGILKPADAEIILTKEMNKDPAYRFLKPWMGNGLLCGELPGWKNQRKSLMPSFRQSILSGFIDVFVEKSEVMTKQMLNTEGTFDAMELVGPAVLDIICEAAMGVTVNAQKNLDSPYIQATIDLSKIIYKRMFQLWLYPEMIYKISPHAKKLNEYVKILHGFTDHIIKIKTQEFEGDNKNTVDDYNNEYIIGDCASTKKKSFLDHLLESGGCPWTDEELRDKVDSMTAAGNDVTAHTTSFTMLMIGAHPEIQEKIFEELYEIFGDSNRSPTKEDLSRMQYLERTIKETMRLFPVAPIIVRHMKQEYKIENYTLPAGARCVIVIYAIHRDKEIWGEKADEFDPDNFLPEKCAKRHPCSFLGFSAGPRNCIGKTFAMMAMKVLLSRLLRSAKIHSDVSPKTLEWVSEVILKPVGGYPITVEPRHY